MWDTIQKLRYRAAAGLPGAKEELDARLNDRIKLPLSGIHGESVYLTGAVKLCKKQAELEVLYDRVPLRRGVKDSILLDAWSSATIEGARTSVDQVKKSFDDPKKKDDIMVVNAVKACRYAYDQRITQKNIRRLWESVVDGACENEDKKGNLYRDGMVHIGSGDRVIHTPAPSELLPELMGQLFSFIKEDAVEPLIYSFAAHFYFVYIHPFCDGNGRTARILNASQLYHAGYRKMKSLPLSNAINNQLSGYYSSLSDSEVILNGQESPWLDISPFVFYMLEAFERCLIDAALSIHALNASEKKLLERMNKAGIRAEITVKKAMQILNSSESASRAVLNGLVKKGYLTVKTDSIPYIYQLQQHFPE